MISYEMFSTYLREFRTSNSERDMNIFAGDSIMLTEDQKKFVKNILNGYVSTTHSFVMRDMIIDLYSEYLKFIHKTARFDHYVSMLVAETAINGDGFINEHPWDEFVFEFRDGKQTFINKYNPSEDMIFRLDNGIRPVVKDATGYMRLPEEPAWINEVEEEVNVARRPLQQGLANERGFRARTGHVQPFQFERDRDANGDRIVPEYTNEYYMRDNRETTHILNNGNIIRTIDNNAPIRTVTVPATAVPPGFTRQEYRDAILNLGRQVGITNETTTVRNNTVLDAGIIEAHNIDQDTIDAIGIANQYDTAIRNLGTPLTDGQGLFTRRDVERRGTFQEYVEHTRRAIGSGITLNMEDPF